MKVLVKSVKFSMEENIKSEEEKRYAKVKRKEGMQMANKHMKMCST